MEAVNPADQLNAVKRIQEALKINPKDTSAMFELAAMQKRTDLKRKLLNKILSIDPIHPQAREMLLELDRLEIHAGAFQPVTSNAIPTSTLSMDQSLEKSFVFRYPILPQIFVYPLLIISLLFMFQAFGDWEAFIFFTVCFLLFLIPVWFISAMIKLDRSGVTMSRLFGIYRQEIEWAQIECIQSTLTGTGMKLKTAEGQSLTISSQMNHYELIVETLMKIRPDLFKAAGFDKANAMTPGASANTFVEPKTFQRNSLINIGTIALGILSCLLSLGVLITQPFVGFIAVIFLALFWVSQLNSPHTISVQDNRLSTKSMRKQEEWTADQIKEVVVK